MSVQKMVPLEQAQMGNIWDVEDLAVDAIPVDSPSLREAWLCDKCGRIVTEAGCVTNHTVLRVLICYPEAS